MDNHMPRLAKVTFFIQFVIFYNFLRQITIASSSISSTNKIIKIILHIISLIHMSL